MIRKRQPLMMLGIVLAMTMALLKLPARTSTQLKLALSGLFLPLFGLSASAQHAAARAGGALLPHHELLQQIETLRLENEKFRIQLAQSAAAEEENRRLRQALDWKQSHDWPLKPAKVVGRDPANWWRTIRIDLGQRDRIPLNAPVLAADGLVGRVSAVGYAHSQVVILGDPDCRVSALIEETRDHGVIAPDSTSPLDNILVNMSYLARTSPLRAGQRVLTSGLGGVFPKGILIGHVVDYHPVDFGLYHEARVRVATKLNALEQVWVLTP